MSKVETERLRSIEFFNSSTWTLKGLLFIKNGLSSRLLKVLYIPVLGFKKVESSLLVVMFLCQGRSMRVQVAVVVGSVAQKA